MYINIIDFFYSFKKVFHLKRTKTLVDPIWEFSKWFMETILLVSEWFNCQNRNTFEHVLRWQLPCVRGSVAAACKFGIERKNVAAAGAAVPTDGIMCCAGCLSGRRVGRSGGWSVGWLACEYISNIDCTAAVQQYSPSRLILFSLSAAHLANADA